MIPCVQSDETPLWLCPCIECTRLEWEAGDQDQTLDEHRRMWWPHNYYPINKKESTQS